MRAQTEVRDKPSVSAARAVMIESLAGQGIPLEETRGAPVCGKKGVPWGEASTIL
jgi:hypothetical protein